MRREKWVYLQNVRSGATKSCGCLAAGLPVLTPVAAVDPLAEYQTLAAARAASYGHALGAFDPDIDRIAAIAECMRCGALAAVDSTESPFMFGHALDRACLPVAVAA